MAGIRPPGPLLGSLATKSKIVDADVDAAAAIARSKLAARPVNTQTGNYGLALVDADAIVRMNKATAVTVTIPANATVAFPVGTIVDVESIGAGATAIAAAGGVTLHSPGNLLSLAQYASARLMKTGTDTWEVLSLSGTYLPLATGLPWFEDLNLCHTPLAQSGSTWALSTSNSQVGCGYIANAAAPAQNDQCDFRMPLLGDGTWQLEVLTFHSATSGIVTVYIDDGAGNFTSVGTIDLYNASNTFNALDVITGIVLTGYVPNRTIRFKVATKNGSSGGYRASLTHAKFRRTA